MPSPDQNQQNNPDNHPDTSGKLLLTRGEFNRLAFCTMLALFATNSMACKALIDVEQSAENQPATGPTPITQAPEIQNPTDPANIPASATPTFEATTLPPFSADFPGNILDTHLLLHETKILERHRNLMTAIYGLDGLKDRIGTQGFGDINIWGAEGQDSSGNIRSHIVGIAKDSQGRTYGAVPVFGPTENKQDTPLLGVRWLDITDLQATGIIGGDRQLYFDFTYNPTGLAGEERTRLVIGTKYYDAQGQEQVVSLAALTEFDLQELQTPNELNNNQANLFVLRDGEITLPGSSETINAHKVFNLPALPNHDQTLITTINALTGRFELYPENGSRGVPDAGQLLYVLSPEGQWAAVEFNLPYAEFRPVDSNLDAYPGIFNPQVKFDTITGVNEAELALLSAEQISRLYRQELAIYSLDTGYTGIDQFIEAMNTFLKRYPSLEIKHYQAPDETLLTVIYDTEQNQIMWGLNPDNSLASVEPHYYLDGTGLTGISLPEGTIPDWQYNQFNRRWNLYALDSNSLLPAYVFKPYQANLENVDQKWQPLYGGEFSEKHQPSYTREYIYKEPVSGLEIPILIGLTDDLPVAEYELNQFGLAAIAETYLTGCYYRFSRLMDNREVTYPQYLNAVKNGLGQVEYRYFDELTGSPSYGMIDPRNGVSITLTGNPEMPLNKAPEA